LNEAATAALSGCVSISACSTARKVASCPLWSNFSSLDSIFMTVAGLIVLIRNSQSTGARALIKLSAKEVRG